MYSDFPALQDRSQHHALRNVEHAKHVFRYDLALQEDMTLLAQVADLVLLGEVNQGQCIVEGDRKIVSVEVVHELEHGHMGHIVDVQVTCSTHARQTLVVGHEAVDGLPVPHMRPGYVREGLILEQLPVENGRGGRQNEAVHRDDVAVDMQRNIAHHLRVEQCRGSHLHIGALHLPTILGHPPRLRNEVNVLGFGIAHSHLDLPLRFFARCLQQGGRASIGAKRTQHRRGPGALQQACQRLHRQLGPPQARAPLGPSPRALSGANGSNKGPRKGDSYSA
mmetsp:Transcript_45834/g.129853  ORF Transcript_45834/g.129853 Transcript_45834/m.129853 type:complete len:279 (-) Transcript_45834:1-837(-)